jgi:hypothetical protein
MGRLLAIQADFTITLNDIETADIGRMICPVIVMLMNWGDPIVRLKRGGVTPGRGVTPRQ